MFGVGNGRGAEMGINNGVEAEEVEGGVLLQAYDKAGQHDQIGPCYAIPPPPLPPPPTTLPLSNSSRSPLFAPYYNFLTA